MSEAIYSSEKPRSMPRRLFRVSAMLGGGCVLSALAACAGGLGPCGPSSMFGVICMSLSSLLFVGTAVCFAIACGWGIAQHLAHR